MAAAEGVTVLVPETKKQRGNRRAPGEEPPTSHEEKAENLWDSLSSLTSDYFLTVHKQSETGEQFCVRYPGDKFDLGQVLEQLQKNYGGGDYRIRLYGGGTRGIKENKLISIAAPVLQNPAPGTAAAPGQAAVPEFFRLLLEQNQQLMARMELALNKPQPDPQEEFERSLNRMKLMREAMGMPAAGAAPAAAAADPFTQFSAMLAGVANMTGSIKDLLPTLMPPGEDKESLTALVREFGPTVLDLVKTGLQREKQQAQLPPPAAGPGQAQNPSAPAPAAPQQAAQEVKLDDNSLAFFKGLQAKAEADQDTGPLAKNLTALPQVVEFLKPLMTDPRPFRVLCTYWPDAMDHPGWWNDLLIDLADCLTKLPAAAKNDVNQGGSQPDKKP